MPKLQTRCSRYCQRVRLLRASPERSCSNPPVNSAPPSPLEPAAVQTPVVPTPDTTAPPASISVKKGVPRVVWVLGGLIAIFVVGVMFNSGALTKPMNKTSSTSFPSFASDNRGELDEEVSPISAKILETGPIRIGSRSTELWPFTILGGTPAGLEPELAKAIVAKMYGGSVSIEWVYLTAAEQFGALANGDIDLLIRNASYSKGRDEFALWTSNYFLDCLTFLVNADGDINSIPDLDGRTFGVNASAYFTTELLIQT